MIVFIISGMKSATTLCTFCLYNWKRKQNNIFFIVVIVNNNYPKRTGTGCYDDGEHYPLEKSLSSRQAL